jgi:predicted RNA-binding protein with PUA domain
MKFTYKLDYSNDEPGGDRGYEVIRRGFFIGYVEKDWRPNATPNGTPVRCWTFKHTDGRWADGKTRAQAVEAALALPVPEKAAP